MKDVVTDSVLHFLVLTLDSAHLLKSLKAHSLNTETVSVVQLSGEPVLATVVRQSLEVVAKILINLNFISVLDQVAFLQANSEAASAAKNDTESNEHKEHGSRRTILVPWPAVVTGRDRLGGIDNGRSGIVENLLVTHNPIAESEIHDWSPSH